MLIPLFSAAFFLQTFITSYISLTFQASSYDYFSLTSLGDYKFFSGLAKIQDSLIKNTTIPTGLSTNYLLYYRDYFNVHYNTFGYLDPFHQSFTSLLMQDICNGTQSAYGLTAVPASCELPLLYPNGSYLVFTDTAVRT